MNTKFRNDVKVNQDGHDSEFSQCLNVSEVQEYSVTTSCDENKDSLNVRVSQTPEKGIPEIPKRLKKVKLYDKEKSENNIKNIEEPVALSTSNEKDNLEFR